MSRTEKTHKHILATILTLIGLKTEVLPVSEQNEHGGDKGKDNHSGTEDSALTPEAKRQRDRRHKPTAERKEPQLKLRWTLQDGRKRREGHRNSDSVLLQYHV